LATALPDLTFAPNATFLTSSDGTALLTQMCHQCHNPSLDQTLTRARFDVTKLTTMPAAELQKAIVRLNLPADSFQKMPPTRFRALSPAEITLATQVLNQ
jgi:cytochrome c553